MADEKDPKAKTNKSATNEEFKATVKVAKTIANKNAMNEEFKAAVKVAKTITKKDGGFGFNTKDMLRALTKGPADAYAAQTNATLKQQLRIIDKTSADVHKVIESVIIGVKGRDKSKADDFIATWTDNIKPSDIKALAIKEKEEALLKEVESVTSNLIAVKKLKYMPELVEKLKGYKEEAVKINGLKKELISEFKHLMGQVKEAALDKALTTAAPKQDSTQRPEQG